MLSFKTDIPQVDSAALTSTSPIIALAGNPNVGKSSLFNALTGAHQHVGNWPGKTVERKAGTIRFDAREITVVDLPGTYSLNAYSAEEIITRDFLVNEKPRVVIAVVDSANLERNLYLVIQLLELDVPLVLALNMVDTARKRGLDIDTALLSARLGGVPVVETVGNRSAGIDDLRDTLARMTREAPPAAGLRVDYGAVLEAEIAALQAQVAADAVLAYQFRPRWLAIKLLEHDEDLRARLDGAGYQALIGEADAAMARISAQTGDDAETLITDRRYQFIAQVLDGAVTRAYPHLETMSDRVDSIAAHPVWGVPIFLLLMWIVFQFTANVSAPFVDWIDGVFSGPLSRLVVALLGLVALDGTWVEALLTDGVITGVGGVLVFIPVMMSLYFAVAVLEDTGYMARSAFVMDGVMRRIGLHGKSFLPLVVGFGCNVPAVYATRTLENESDRKLTGFLVSFMSCGARLPVYVIFGAAFFGANSGNLVFGMYLVGIGVALLTGFLLKRTAFRNEPQQPFVLEMPPYRVPDWKNVVRQVWHRTQHFLEHAATIILVSSLVIWALMAIPTGRGKGQFADVHAEDSVFGTVSKTISPVFAPAGFDSWQATGSLLTGFVAKEVVISTMNQIYIEKADPETASDADSGDNATVLEETRDVVESLGKTMVLTAQEAVNIIPRTANLLPGVTLPEADWLGQNGEDDTTALQAALTTAFSRAAGSETRGKLAAVAFNVFVLLYVPCMATVAAMRQEFGTRWMLYQIVYTLSVAWLAALLVYQGGLLLGFA